MCKIKQKITKRLRWKKKDIEKEECQMETEKKKMFFKRNLFLPVPGLRNEFSLSDARFWEIFFNHKQKKVL